jgi:AhpD family alkylhydroperoxidase
MIAIAVSVITGYAYCINSRTAAAKSWIQIGEYE